MGFSSVVGSYDQGHVTVSEPIRVPIAPFSNFMEIATESSTSYPLLLEEVTAPIVSISQHKYLNKSSS